MHETQQRPHRPNGQVGSGRMARVLFVPVSLLVDERKGAETIDPNRRRAQPKVPNSEEQTRASRCLQYHKIIGRRSLATRNGKAVLHAG